MAIVIVVGTGEPTTGLWCPHCLKPSGYEVPLYSLTTAGVSRFGVIRKCADCDAPIEHGSA